MNMLRVGIRRGTTGTASGVVPSVRRGFSFTEILFAVMILGIGFIMVAAIFPVAIKQTALTGEDSRGAAMAISAASAMQNLATNQNLRSGFLPADPEPLAGAPVNGAPLTIGSRVWTFHDARLNTPADNTVADQMWAAVAGNMIYASDPRYAWIPMYRRDMILNSGVNRISATKNDYSLSQTAQLIMIGVQVRNHARYDAFRDLQHFNSNFAAPQAVLEPVLTRVKITRAGDTFAGRPATINFSSFNTPPENGRVGEGTFIVISNDGLGYPQDANGYYSGFNGRILRVGNYRPDLMAGNSLSPIFELAPGYDINVNLSAADVLLVGRGYAKPQETAAGYDGGVQDIAVYTTFVRVQ